jgi:2,4-dienoyl-CoA reductase-like NADH-dependent reductase (Old Yellow Enzyme family)/AraC-like DNA-binding protein
MPAMGTQLASDTGAVTQRLIDYHAERSKGLVGLQITEVACIDSPLGKTIVNQLRIDHDRYVPGLNQLVEAVHLHEGKMAVQLHHAGRQTNLIATEDLQPVSASDVAYIDEYGIPPGVWISRPRTLTLEEIQRLVEKFAESAERAKRSQMDAVELHGAHGYLIGQFLSPYTNNRTDAYGGSLEKRLRFAVEIVERTRERVGANFPIIFRISADEMIPEGLKLDEAKIICKSLDGSNEDLWRVVVKRDYRYDNSFVFGVKSTKIYCRPSCPARTPHREQIVYFLTARRAEEAGFRACKRCRPNDEDFVTLRRKRIEDACVYMNQNLGSKLSLQELGKHFGMNPYHFQRTFKRYVGITPRQYAEVARLRKTKLALRNGQTIRKALYQYQSLISAPTTLFVEFL